MKWRIASALVIASLVVASIWFIWLREAEAGDYLDSETSKRACQLEDAEDWQAALESWRNWNPKHPFCGTCDLGFQRRRHYRIYHCMLRIGEHARVASELLEGIQAACRPDDDGWSRYERNQLAQTFLPMLIELYDRADQIDDLRRLVNRVEAKAKFDCGDKKCVEAIYAEWPTRAIRVGLLGQIPRGEIADLPPPAMGSLPRVLPE